MHVAIDDILSTTLHTHTIVHDIVLHNNILYDSNTNDVIFKNLSIVWLSISVMTKSLTH